jgi:hypothetical protein
VTAYTFNDKSSIPNRDRNLFLLWKTQTSFRKIDLLFIPYGDWLYLKVVAAEVVVVVTTAITMQTNKRTQFDRITINVLIRQHLHVTVLTGPSSGSAELHKSLL